MSDFKKFTKQIEAQFTKMIDGQDRLFLTDIERDTLWENYLDSFPAGTNDVYRERRSYDCATCRQFIRPYGNIVTIKDNKLISMWDVEDVAYPFDIVAQKMSALVKSTAIKNVFISDVASLGTPNNKEITEDGTILTWNHFAYKLPKSYVTKLNGKSIEALQGPLRDNKNVFQRSMEELTLESGHTVLELIQQKTLYRGEEHLSAVNAFIKYKTEFDKVPVDEVSNWCWVNSFNNPIVKIRNNAIGTLLVDISEDVPLDDAVRKFEKVMAPANYKRPNAIFTKKMIADAEKTITELGYADSLGRRAAILSDITVNDVLFVDRDAKGKLGKSVFDSLADDIPDDPKKFNKVEEVNIDTFINDIVPTAKSISLIMENRHKNNLMSLIAPADKKAPSMLKWGNNFSWSYNGDVADSMKERVKSAGGDVEGVLRFSIQWNEKGDTNKDYDAHCWEPDGSHIFYGAKSRHRSGGNLDVDVMQPGESIAVENITWPVESKMQDGIYEFKVKNYSGSTGNSGFTAEIEYNGDIYQFEYPKGLRGGEYISVAKIKFIKEEGLEFIESLDSTVSAREVWGVKTNQFTKASVIMHSPNYWDDSTMTGNKHYFFFFEGCKSDESPRGFYNEHLDNALMPHRKVFEALGSKMHVEPVNGSLAGLGFSSTKHDSIIAKVDGTFSRVIKINF